jgi:hypothetical protein
VTNNQVLTWDGKTQNNPPNKNKEKGKNCRKFGVEHYADRRPDKLLDRHKQTRPQGEPDAHGKERPEYT